MIRVFSSHLRGNVIAYVALFAALGGTSYAAVKLPANSVGSKQLKKNAVTAAKIKAGAVDGTKIKAGTLKATAFAPGQAPTGPKGDTGATGPAGANGTNGAAGAKGDKGDKGNPGDPATADGASVQTGRINTAGFTVCITAAASGYSPTASCDVAGLVARAGVVPTDRVVRNFSASIPTTVGNTLRVYLVNASTASPFLHCDIPPGQKTCALAGPV